MRVALFTETYLPVINGVVTHVKTLKDGLESLGHKVIVVTADSRFKKHKFDGHVIYCPAVKLKKIYNYDVASPISIDRMKLIKEFNPDIIHIHNEFGIGISGIIISRILNIPLVYTLHTMYDDYIYYVANKHSAEFVTKATHSYARAIANTAGAITGPSKKVDEYIKKCGVKKDVNVIPNSVELDIFTRDNLSEQSLEKASAIRKEFGFSDDDTVFSFCGRLGKEKNISLLIDYVSKEVKENDRIKIIIIGGGPLYDEHVKEAKNKSVDNIIKFTGAVEHVDLIPYYAASDAYITASLSDTCSISMLEAMAMELPVLHIKDELNAGQVVNGVNGYIYSNSSEMYEFMKQLRDMPKAELAEFGKKARLSVISSGADALAKSVLEIYDAVILDKNNKRRKFKAYKTFKE